MDVMCCVCVRGAMIQRAKAADRLDSAQTIDEAEKSDIHKQIE